MVAFGGEAEGVRTASREGAGVAFEVTFRNGDAAARKLEEVRARIERGTARGLDQYARRGALRDVRRFTPKRTGHLRRRWRTREVEPGRRYMLENDARYAGFVFRHPRYVQNLQAAAVAIAREGAAAVREEIKRELDSMTD